MGDDLPVLEMGYNTTAELLQKVPGIEVVRPPKGSSVMVFSTNPPDDEQEEEEAELDKGKKMDEEKISEVSI